MRGKVCYPYEVYPLVANQLPLVAEQICGLASVFNPHMGGIGNVRRSMYGGGRQVGLYGLGQEAKPAFPLGLAMGTGAVGLALAATGVLFHYGVAREAKSKLVRTTGYIMAGVGALGVALGAIGLLTALAKPAAAPAAAPAGTAGLRGMGAGPEEAFMGRLGMQPEEEFMGHSSVL